MNISCDYTACSRPATIRLRNGDITHNRCDEHADTAAMRSMRRSPDTQVDFLAPGRFLHATPLLSEAEPSA